MKTHIISNKSDYFKTLNKKYTYMVLNISWKILFAFDRLVK